MTSMLKGAVTSRWNMSGTVCVNSLGHDLGRRRDGESLVMISADSPARKYLLCRAVAPTSVHRKLHEGH